MAAPSVSNTKAGKRPNRTKSTAAIALALALIVLVSVLGYSYMAPRSPPPNNITLGLQSYTNSAWPVYIANDTGIFRKYQLNVTVVAIGSGRDIVTALQARQIDIGWTSPDVVINSALEGFIKLYPDQWFWFPIRDGRGKGVGN